MHEIIPTLVDAVNLDGYSNSPGYIGFFGKSEKYQAGMAESAVDFFIDFLAADFSRLIIVSSLHANADQVGFSGDQQADLEDLARIAELSDKKLIRTISYRKTFGPDYESAVYERAMRERAREFAEFPASAYPIEVIKRFLLAKIMVFGLYGHCFLVVEGQDLAFYPHDDLGFGVIALSERADLDKARDFLRRAGELESFCAVIEA